MGNKYTPDGLEPHCRPSILGFGLPPSSSGLNGGSIAPSSDRFPLRGYTAAVGRPGKVIHRGPGSVLAPSAGSGSSIRKLLQLLRPRIEVHPPLELRGKNMLDFLCARAIALDRLRTMLVIVRRRHALGQRVLLALQSFQLRG